MSKFTSGQVPYPDYDAADTTNFNRKVEFTDDEVGYNFTQIFEFIQRFIKEENKDNYEVWH